ncbi:hypothetical protein [Deinococcus irradiatisoli]|uniref:hypothetical protein n=1 Tax=Deinococcus irradiatisoli TaxID=2202254 RepID=UPI0015E86720|nr:hypothetical protein [Deinococcus irradiatisoli]
MPVRSLPPEDADAPRALPIEPAEERGPAPVGTLVVIAILLLSIVWLWMLVLGVQQGRA